MQLSLPEDVFLNIASRLQETDVCALGSCNRFWREPCGYDSLWEIFARRRWPSWSLCQNSSSSSETPDKGWRNLYVKRHNEVADVVRPLVDSVQESQHTSQSLEIRLYRKIFGELKSLELSFIDVKMLMFKPKFSTLLHLVGLHYCCVFLQVPVKDMVKAVVDSKISEGQVCVQWMPRGRLFHFHSTDEPRFLLASLNEIASSRGHGVLRVLTRGAVHKQQQLISHANAKSKNEKFHPPHQDGVLGYPLGSSHHIDPGFDPPDVSSSSTNLSYPKPSIRTWSDPLGDSSSIGASQKKKHLSGDALSQSKSQLKR